MTELQDNSNTGLSERLRNDLRFRKGGLSGEA